MSTSLVIFLSDLHAGKTLPHFNRLTFRDRLMSIPKQLKARKGPPPDEVFLILGGDIVDGEGIYQHHNSVNKHSLHAQTTFAAKHLQNMIIALQKVVSCPIFIKSIPGNHGRASLTHHPHTNFDTMVGELIAAKFSDTPNIDVEVTTDKFLVVQVQQARLLCYHEGVPHISTPSNRLKFVNWLKHFKCQALLHGHHHQMSFVKYGDGWKIANGSLAGEDDYGTEIAAFDPAAQVFFYVKGQEFLNFDYFRWA